MKPEEQRNDLLAGRLIKQLEQRHYNAMYCKTAQEAVKTIVGLIPDGSSVTWGGSMTIRDMGLTKALHDRASLEIWDRDLAPDRDAARPSTARHSRRIIIFRASTPSARAER